MLRLYKNTLVFIAAILVIWFLLGKMKLMPSFNDIFGSKAVRIDETPILINDIKELAELTTMVSFDEVVVDSITADPTALAIKTITGLSLNPLSPGYDRLVLICKGSLKAGTDLATLDPNAIFREKDSVSLGLPPARILEITINPSGVETFIETGNWSAGAFEKVKIKARDKIRDRALSEDILGKANARSKLLMDNFLRQSGFTKVNVYTKY
jgi:Protein of unknown function (DUF4230)